MPSEKAPEWRHILTQKEEEALSPEVRKKYVNDGDLFTSTSKLEVTKKLGLPDSATWNDILKAKGYI